VRRPAASGLTTPTRRTLREARGGAARPPLWPFCAHGSPRPHRPCAARGGREQAATGARQTGGRETAAAPPAPRGGPHRGPAPARHGRDRVRPVSREDRLQAGRGAACRSGQAGSREIGHPADRRTRAGGRAPRGGPTRARFRPPARWMPAPGCGHARAGAPCPALPGRRQRHRPRTPARAGHGAAAAGGPTWRAPPRAGPMTPPSRRAPKPSRPVQAAGPAGRFSLGMVSHPTVAQGLPSPSGGSLCCRSRSC
jgi:hypothetical protein